MKKTTTRIVAILIAVVLLIGCSIGIISASAAPGYNTTTVQQIEAKLKEFEDKVSGGTIYTNVDAAYTAYVNLSRTLDRYYYGNDSSIASQISNQMTALTNAMNAMQVWSMPTPKNNNIADNAYDSTYVWANDSNEGNSYAKMAQYYTNVIWGETGGGSNWERANVTGTGNASNLTMSFYYPIYALVVDGENTPKFAVMIRGVGNGGSKRYFYAASINNPEDGISLERNWTSGTKVQESETAFNFGWNINTSTIELSYSKDTHSASTKNAGQLRKEGLGSANYTKTYANYMLFTGSFASGEYQKAIYPKLRTMSGSNATPSGQGNWSSDCVVDLDTTSNGWPIRILNYKVLVDTLKTGFAKLANVKQYREGGLTNLVTALNAAMSYNYNTDFQGIGYSGVANAVNTAAGKIQTYVNNINNAAITQDRYNDLRSAINNARALYFEDNANPGGTNPVKANGRVKYCPEPWKEFVTAYANAGDVNRNASAFMKAAGTSGNYNDPSTANTLKEALNTARTKVTEHTEGTTFEQIPASGSDYYNTKYKMATCEEDGLVARFADCPNCNVDIYLQDVTINAAGHTNMTEHKGWNATCTQDGAVTYYTCDRAVDNAKFIAAGCEKIFSDALGKDELNGVPDPIPATEHKYVLEQEGKEKTCMNGTYYTIWRCTVCDKYFTDNSDPTSEDYKEYDAIKGEQNDKVDHHLVQKDANPATCESEGNLEYWYCDNEWNCGTLFRTNNQNDVWEVTDTDTPFLPQLSHNFINYTYDEGSQTCLTDGTETAYCEYEMNQPEDERETHTRPAEGKAALGHNWTEEHSYNPATCVDPGNIEYYYCDRCETNYYEKEDYTTAAVTGDTTIPAIGEHNLIQHYAVKATCQNDGWADYWECSLCKACYSSNDQTGGLEAFEAKKIADSVDKISEWSDYTTKENGEHVLIAHEAKKATCIKDDNGWDAYWQCALCNKLYSAGDQSVENFENNLIDVTDITQWDGYHPYTSVDHDVKDVTEPATCVAPGYGEHYECNVCHKWFNAAENGEEIEERPNAPIDENNHTGNWKTYDKNDGATCQQDGWSATVYQCLDCGAFYSKYNAEDNTTESVDKLGDKLEELKEYTPATDHQSDDGKTEIIIESTCVTLGYQQTTYSCIWCETILGTNVEQLEDKPENYAAHQPTVHIPYKEPTCMATGVAEHYECSVCGKYFKVNGDVAGEAMTDEEIAAVTLPSVGHDFTIESEEPVTAATCTANAVYEYTCRFEGCTASTQREKADTATGHNFEDGEHAQKAATCLTDGVPETYYTCSVCGLNYTSNELYTTDIYSGYLSIPATGHNFVAYAGTEATCKTPGQKTYYTCSNPGCELEGGKLLSNTNTKATADDCIKSDEELKTAKDPLAHPQDALSYVPAKAYDCKTWSSGMRAHNYCSECGNYYELSDIWYEHAMEESDFIIAPEHTLVHYDAQEKTCLDDGWSDFYYCTVCNPEPNEDMELFSAEEKATSEHGDLTLDDVLDEAVGHTFTTYADAVTATCVTEGNLGYAECDVCGIKVLCDSLEQAKADKLWFEGDDSDNVELGLNPDNHEGPFTKVDYKKDECLENGVNEHYVCACGAKFKDAEGTTPATEEDIVIPATGHSFKDEGAKHDAVLPTCTNPGTRMYYTCDKCHNNYALDDPNQVVELTDTRIDPTYQHKLVAHNGRNATCVQEGYDSYYECSLCGKTFSSGNQGEATEEAFNEFNETYGITVTPTYGVHMFIHFSEVKATCVVAGYDEYWECAVCQKKFSSNNEEEMKADLEAFNAKYDITETFAPATDPDEHSIISTGGTPATCVAPGEKAHYECEWCHEWFASDAKGAEKVAKTPAEAPIDPNNHVNAWIEHTEQTATCTQEGWKQTVYECKACGAFYSAKDGAKTESKDFLAKSKADLTDAYYEAQKPHDEDGDTKQQPLIASTCTTPGYKLVTYTCSMCGADQRTELVPLELAEHQTSTKVDVKAPTCYSDGVKKAYFICSVCGDYFEVGENDSVGDKINDKNSVVDPRVSHDYEGGEIKKTLVDPTCTEYAVVEVECVYGCGATINRSATDEDGEEYAPIDHDYEKHEGIASTCVTAGYETYYTCNNGCGTLFSAEDPNAIITEIQYKEINPNAHPEASVSKPEEGAAVEATCTESGWVERSYCSECGKYFADGIGPKESIEDPAFVVGALGHEYVEHEAKVSTCKTKGNDLYYTCSNEGCDLYFSAKDANRVIDGVPERDLDPTNHEVALTQIGEAKAATCLDTGLMAIYQCPACEKYFDNEEGTGIARDSADDNSFVIPATGHDFEFVQGNPAKCDPNGEYSKDHYICKNDNCDLIFLDATNVFDKGVDEDEISLDADPTNHTNRQYVGAKDPTCDPWTDGVKAHYYCDGCGKYYDVSNLDEAVEDPETTFAVAPQHKLTFVEGKAATCVKDGEKNHWECTVCSKYFTSDDPTVKDGVDYDTDIKLGATGHSFYTVKENEVPGKDCQTHGTYDEVTYCSNADCEYNDKAYSTEAKKSEVGPHIPGEAKQENVKDATCESNGSYDLVTRCTVCDAELNKVENLVIAATGHEFKNYTQKTPASCTEAEVLIATCEHNCGATDEKEGASALGHTWCDEDHSYKAPTCEEDGNILYYHCTRCDKNYYDNGDTTTSVIEGSTVLTKTDHLLIHHDAHTGDCQNLGWEEYYECAYCETKFEDADGKNVIENFDTEWKQLGDHNIQQVGGTPATCIAGGEDAHFECLICGNWFNDTEGTGGPIEKSDPATGVNKNNHVNGWITHNAYTEKDCKEDYWKQNVYECAACGKFYSAHDEAATTDEAYLGASLDDLKAADIYAEKLDHNFTDEGCRVEKTELQKPSCTLDGIYLVKTYCSLCDEAYESSTENTGKLAHTSNYVEEDPATCQKTGLAAHYECTVCGQLFAAEDKDCTGEPVSRDSLVIGVKEHDYTGDSEVVTAATCLKYAVIKVECVYGCGATETRSATATDDEKYAPTGHKERKEIENDVEGVDCQNVGTYDEVVYCDNEWCDLDGVVSRETKNNDKYGPHVPGEAQQEERVEAKCTEDGSYKLVTRCQYHSEQVLSSEAKTIDATGHSFHYEEAVTPTCENGGNKAYYTCDNADCNLYFLDASESSRFDKVGVDYATDIKLDKDPNNHTQLAHVDEVPATCDKSGMRAHYHCEGCGNYYEVSDLNTPVKGGEAAFVIDAAHTLVPVAEKTATCVDPGWGEYWQCSVCNKFFNSDDPSADGLDSLEDLDSYLEHGAHVLVHVNEKTATCIADGWDEYWYCALCENYYDADMPTDYDFDTFEEHNLNIDAITEWEDGYHHKEDADHVIKDNLATPATCVAPGYDEHYACEVCHKWFSDENGTDPIDEKPVAPIDLNNHVGEWITNAKKDATCEETGYLLDNVQCSACGNYYADKDHTTEDDILELKDVIDPIKSHNEDEVITTPIADSTCTMNGYELITYQCDMCHSIQRTEIKTLALAEHQTSKEEAKAPTCYSDGVKRDYLVCSVCGKYFEIGADGAIGDEITDKNDVVDPMVPHEYTGEIKVLRDPTCTEYAYITVACKYGCGAVETRTATDTDGEDYGPIGHAYHEQAETDSTCVDAGHELYYTCDNNCGTLFDADKEIIDAIPYKELDPNAHPEGKVTLAAAAVSTTCLTDGWVDRYQCSECGKWFADAAGAGDPKDSAEDASFAVKTNGHAFVKHDATDPTCTTKGYDLYYSCENCELYFSAEDAYRVIDEIPYKDIDKNAHPDGKVTLAAEAVKETCTTDGWVDRYQCSECGKWFDNAAGTGDPKDSAEDVSFKTYATDHSFTVYESDGNATCLTDGTETAICDNCGVEKQTRTEANSATGHDFVLVDEKAKGATCLEDGVKAHYECQNGYCDLTVDGVKAKFLDNKDTKAEAGVDDSELVIEKNLDQASHVNLHFEKGYDPICSPWTVGMRDHITCDCGTYYEVSDVHYQNPLTKADFEIQPQHTLKDMGEQAKTCEVDGYNHYWECTVEGCGAQFLADTPEIDKGVVYETDILLPKTDHKPGEAVIENAVDGADCQHNGSHDEVVYCQNDWCDVEGGKELSRVNVEDEVGDHVAAEPQWEDVVDATCTEDGHYDLVTRCELCGTELDRVKDQVITAKGHDWEEDYTIDQKPTCTEEGSKSHHCKNCDAQTEPESVPANGHSYGDWETIKSPDCLNGGSRKRTCEVCGFVETEDLDPNGHDWEEDYTIDQEPTCTEDGSKSRHCKNCDAQIDSEVITATGHDWSDWKTLVEPDCKNGGSAERTCSNCGKVESKDLEAKGHDWEENYTIDEAPTCTEEGSKSIHCKNCDETKNSETVPALGHDIVTDPAVSPTATENGLTEGEHCSRGDYKKEQEVIPATGEYALVILEGENQTYLIDSNDTKTIVCSGNYNMFVELLLDGVHVDAANYTLAEGSTIVTFKPEFLNTLAPGKYKVTLVYTYDSIDTTLTVVEKVTEAPTEETTKAPSGGANNSGTSPNTGLVITIPVLSLAALAGGSFFLGYARKKKNEDEE